jgi:DNA-directed RNA polymerase specialized sigma24 family protein
MLVELVKIQPELIQMAKSINIKDYKDILQDTYIKLNDSKKQFNEIDKGYIYLTMRSVWIDKVRKNKEIPFNDFSYFECEETEYKEVEIDLSVLNLFEKELKGLKESINESENNSEE